MAALAVSPKPKELAMTNDAVQKQYYLDIEGEQVAVSKEVYLAYMQPIWREQKRVERQKRYYILRDICQVLCDFC